MKRVTRRSVLGSAAALWPLWVTERAAAGAEPAKPVGEGVQADLAGQAGQAGRVRLLLWQSPWSSADSEAHLASRILATAVPGVAGPGSTELPILFVMSPATMTATPPLASEFYQRLEAVARRTRVTLAGAACLRAGSRGPALTEGFLIASDGRVLLRAPKITPDVLAGFSETTCALAEPAAFPVARLPFGAVGLLVGEDVFRPSHVRALCFNGAEILLNCATEVADPALPARRDAMAALAYCHMAYVAVTTGVGPSRTGLWDWAGSAVSPEGADSFTTVIDIERLRVARHDGLLGNAYASTVLPPMVRDGLYGPAFAAAAAARAAVITPSTRAGWAQEAARRIAVQSRRTTPEASLLPSYDAVLMQTGHRSVAAAADRRAAISANIRDLLAAAEPHARRPLTKLVMFGEFAFTGAGYRTIPDSLSVALSWPGPELAQLAEFAARHGVYVAAQQIELDPKFPGRVFNTAFLFDAAGNLASRHRKLQCVDLLGTFPDTTPGSIYDRYVAEYGVESLWQVVDTPLGKLAPMIAIENLFPEVAQVYAQQGAEVYLQLSSEGWDPLTGARYAWDAARRQHAFETSAYFLTVNEGDDPALRDPYHAAGLSHAIDPYGRVIGLLRDSHPGVLLARIDLDLLRTARADPRSNLGIWDEPRVYADAYQRGLGVANNLWAAVPPEDFPYRDLAVYQDVVRRYDSAGVFTPPRQPR
jgi:predicted amidohydrolase